MSHQNVLDKLLSKKNLVPGEEKKLASSDMVVDYFKSSIRPGRPAVEKKLKARNFTVCMAPNYIKFLDAFKPPIKKVQGRGRKLRFIIDEFIRMSKRQKSQLKYMQEALKGLEQVLNSFSGEIKKNEKLVLSSREKQLISTHVNRVKLLVKLLSFSKEELKKILPPHDWNLYSFCLNWNQYK